ncbi:hypothetical protein LCGC14_2070140 [marine sediment metagenome]|uniref:Uncharacterized protein n=1 Tax=marine sediment metagenome TaxID=412755 RepID=A0A0F9F615_9ZZZZ
MKKTKKKRPVKKQDVVSKAVNVIGGIIYMTALTCIPVIVAGLIANAMTPEDDDSAAIPKTPPLSDHQKLLLKLKKKYSDHKIGQTQELTKEECLDEGMSENEYFYRKAIGFIPNKPD